MRKSDFCIKACVEERLQGGMAGGQEPLENARLMFLVNLGSHIGGRGGNVKNTEEVKLTRQLWMRWDDT